MKRLATYSQHFLRSPRLVAELIGHSAIKRRDTVVDIGAGSGVITAVLACRVQNVIAIESEPIAARKLQHNVAALNNVDIVVKDFFTWPLPEEPYSVFANIPFSLSSPIVRRLTEADNPPDKIYLIVQRQFARKLVPSDRHFTSELGIEIAPWFAARIRRPLRRTDFTPPPAVDTVFLELLRRADALLPWAQREQYGDFIQRSFADIRYFQRLHRVHIDPSKKPSELTVNEWLQLFIASR